MENFKIQLGLLLTFVLLSYQRYGDSYIYETITRQEFKNCSESFAVSKAFPAYYITTTLSSLPILYVLTVYKADRYGLVIFSCLTIIYSSFQYFNIFSPEADTLRKGLDKKSIFRSESFTSGWKDPFLFEKSHFRSENAISGIKMRFPV